MNPTLLLAGGLGILWIANVQGQTPTSYTGASNGVWNSAGNWTPSGVPTAASEVGVTNGTRVYIKTTTAALASNVTIGGSSGTSAIRIDSATTNSLTVGGNITLASGAGHGSLEIGENNGGKASLTLNGGTGSILNGGGGGNANIDIYNHVGTLGLSSANADNLQINVGGSASLTIGTNQTWNVGNAYIGKNSANAAYAMTVEGIFNASRLDVGAGAAAGTNSARLIFNSGTIGASLIQRTGTMDSEFIWNEGRIYKEGANVTVGGTANILTIRLAGTGEHVFEATAGKTNTVNTFAVLADKSGEAGTLTKRGAGTLLFLGTHTYTGLTKVESGRLVISNAIFLCTVETNSTVLAFTNALSNGVYAILSGPVSPTSIASNSVVASIPSGSSAVLLNEPNLRLKVATSATVLFDTVNPTITYNGSPQAITASTTPPNLTCQITYNGSVNPPSSAGTYRVTATVTDPSYAGSASTTLTILRGTPTIISNPVASAITFGQSLSDSVLSGGEANVPGEFRFKTPLPNITSAGNNSVIVRFYPTDSSNYEVVTPINLSVQVSKATPTITTYPTASPITFGQALSDSVLSGGEASIGGGFSFVSPTMQPPEGTSNQLVRFTPEANMASNYNPVDFDVTLTVSAAAGFNLNTWLSGQTMSPTVLGTLAIGGASSASANDGEKPRVSIAGGELVLSAIVRTNGPRGLEVVGEAVSSLADYGTPLLITSVNGVPAAVQGTVPEGCQRQEFKVDQGTSSRMFLRLRATLP